MHQDATAILKAGIDSVRPENLFPTLFKNPSDYLTRWQNAPHRWLLSLGKAGVSSAATVLQLASCKDYFVISPHTEISDSLDINKIHFGSHPLPDQNSFQAAAKLREWLEKIPDRGSLLIMLSGGASSLMASPAPGISDHSKTILNDLLIRCGASITEVNTVRKHCSSVKGGQLGLAVARLETMVMVISDVASDDLSAIGSGPFFPDSTTFTAAKEVLESYQIWNQVPEDIRKRIKEGIAGAVADTPKPGSISIRHLIVASNKTARNAAGVKAEQLGYSTKINEEPLVGRIEDAASTIRNRIKSMLQRSVLILGGEVTVQVQGNGVGGRNQHLALLMTEALSNQEIVFAAAGTDGIDGNSPAAGAWVDGKTFTQAIALKLPVQEYINSHDSYHFFRALNQSIVTGPTGTNVMDLYLILSA